MQKKVITGIYVTLKAVESAVVSKRGNKGIELISSKRKDVNWPDAEDKLDPKTLRRVLPGIDGAATVVLSDSNVLYRVFSLPTIVHEELASMVELKVDQFSPFAAEQTMAGFEVMHADDTSSHVLVAILDLAIIERLGAVFKKAGVIPYRVDLPELIHIYALKEGKHISEHGQHGVLLVEGNLIYHAVFHYGSLIMCRNIATQDELKSAEGMVDILHELDYSQTVVDAEWEWAEQVKLTVVAQDAARFIPSVMAPLRARCPHGYEVIDANDLPPLSEGAARRSLDRTSASFNLVPMAWHDAERYRRQVRKFLSLLVVLFICWGCGIGVFSYYAAVQQQKINLYMQDKEKLEAAVSMVRKLKDKSISIERYADRSTSALECLREISSVLPNGVELSSFIYKKGKGITLKGECVRADPIHDFIALLEKSSLFVAVKTGSIVGNRQRGVVRTEFNVKLQLPQEDEEEE